MQAFNFGERLLITEQQWRKCLTRQCGLEAINAESSETGKVCILEQGKAASFSHPEGIKVKQDTDGPFGLCFIMD